MSQRDERSQQTELERVIHWLIHYAASRAPECLSSRLEEEWLADLEYRSSALSRVGLALGCCWATMLIVNEHSRIGVPATSHVVAARGYIPRADRNFGYFSLRSGTLFLILGLHAAIFCGLITTIPRTGEMRPKPDLPDLVRDSVPIEATILPGR
jgi:hypothetical protein